MPADDTDEAALDRIIRRFERSLGQSADTKIEEFLEEIPERNSRYLLVRLLQVEYRHRWEAGKCPTVEEYRARFSSHDKVVDDALLKQNEQSGLEYVLIERIGEGGCGTVFRARDITLERDVAIKVAREGSLSSPDSASRFDREIRILANIERDGIVRVYACRKFKNQQRYLVMQLMNNGSLRRIINENPEGTPPSQVVQIISAVANSVEFVHRRSTRKQALVHRDLKPENILLDKDFKPSVADFGLAAFAEDLHSREAPSGASLSYASPEQARNLLGRKADVDTRSDIWSLGVILYELLTGKLPFVEATRDELIESIERYEPTAPKDLNQSIPQSLDEVVRKCLRKDPNERFQSAADLADRLSEYAKISIGDISKPSSDPFEFAAYLRDRHKNFVGRKSVIEEIRRYLLDNHSGTLIIEAEPGTGKSALVAHCIRDEFTERSQRPAYFFSTAAKV